MDGHVVAAADTRGEALVGVVACGEIRLSRVAKKAPAVVPAEVGEVIEASRPSVVGVLGRAAPEVVVVRPSHHVLDRGPPEVYVIRDVIPGASGVYNVEGWAKLGNQGGIHTQAVVGEVQGIGAAWQPLLAHLHESSLS